MAKSPVALHDRVLDRLVEGDIAHLEDGRHMDLANVVTSETDTSW